MHTDHDLDFVIALADGSLADPTPAEELIAACSECAETYEAYLTVRAAVATAPAPRMTDLERRRLSNSLWSELEQENPADAAPTLRTGSTTPRTPWWYRVAPVAAALVVVVGVAANLTGDSAPSTSVDAGGELSDTAEEGMAGADESAADMMALPETSASDGSSPTTAAAYQREMIITRDDLEVAIDDFTGRAERGEVPPLPADETCAVDEVDGESVIASESATLDGEPVLFVALGTPTEVADVIVYHQSDCTILYDPR